MQIIPSSLPRPQYPLTRYRSGQLINWLYRYDFWVHYWSSASLDLKRSTDERDSARSVLGHLKSERRGIIHVLVNRRAYVGSQRFIWRERGTKYYYEARRRLEMTEKRK